MKAADQATGRLPGDTCDRDWIWDREVETEDHAQALARGEAAWEQQWRHLMESSAFYRRRFGEAGIGPDLVRLTDISRLPLTSKADLKEAIDELPPFGTNLCVPEERVKRVYQTSGTSGAPSVLALTPGDIEMWTTIGTRTYYTSGIHDHHSVLSTFGAGPFVAGHTYFVLARIGTRVVPLGPVPLARGRSGAVVAPHQVGCRAAVWPIGTRPTATRAAARPAAAARTLECRR